MRFLLFLAVLALLAGGAAVINLRSFNQFRSVESVPLPGCTPVKGIAGPEDISVDDKRGLAFISSLDRRDSAARGAIHLFDMDDPLASDGFRDRTMGAPQDFRPLGLDYYEHENVRRLFVVNEVGPSVEMFAVEDNGDLTHLETYAERRLTSPNSVAATGPRSFYVTNDVRPGRNARIANLHFLLRHGLGDIYHVDGDVWRHAAGGLRFANGLALTPEGEKLYVAETAGMAVRVYDREAGALRPAETIRIGASPDNITIDQDGNVWVGALPKPLKTPALKKNASAIAPSEVLLINKQGGARTVYRNAGEEISASTVAARAGDRLVLGALYEQKFLLCDLPKRIN
ncbi:SMP-30/gluconolactonase/LRE family protein [Hyphococcus sp.]|uniref:SMP-30/gluconolactonase/LRE family protein n=1 Tax=Hyphococcus sp. TaxID=2038636 RepID=UPI003CCBACE2